MESMGLLQEERPEDFVGLEIPDRRIVQASCWPALSLSCFADDGSGKLQH